MSRKRSKRVFWELYSRLHENVEVTAVSARRYAEHIKCAVCSMPRREWHQRPVPIEFDITTEPRGPIVTLLDQPDLFRHDLLDVLGEHLRGGVRGAVHRTMPTEERVSVPYSSYGVPQSLQLEADRGPYCRHVQCRGCGRFGGRVVGWSRGAIVERYLDDRLVYLDSHWSIYVDSTLARDLRLKQRFPDLRFHRVDVIPEPLDGDTLPGDPGWDGTFMPRPLPQLPRAHDELGRWTFDEESSEEEEGWVTLYLPGRLVDTALVDVSELERELTRTVCAAKAGEWEAHGEDARRDAWYVRFHGPDVYRLVEAVKYGLRRFYSRLPKRAYLSAKVKGGRERRLSMY